MSYPPPPGAGAPGGFPPPPGGYPPPGGGGFQGGGGFGPQPAQQTNGMAIAALVVGIVTIVSCLFPLGVVAAVLGFLGLKKAKELNGNGRGLAIGGIVTGLIGLISGLILVFGVFLAADSVNDNLDDINSDPSDGVCNEDRFIQDPDC